MLDAQQLGGYIDAHFTSTLFRLVTLDRYDIDSDGDAYGSCGLYRGKDRTGQGSGSLK